MKTSGQEFGVYCRFRHGKNTAEIAKAIGMPENHVDRILSRALDEKYMARKAEKYGVKFDAPSQRRLTTQDLHPVKS